MSIFLQLLCILGLFAGIVCIIGVVALLIRIIYIKVCDEKISIENETENILI